MNWITIHERWKAVSPPFFRTIYQVAAWAVSGSLAVLTLKASGTISFFPPWIESVCTYVAIAGTFAGVTAKLTKQ